MTKFWIKVLEAAVLLVVVVAFGTLLIVSFGVRG